MKAFYKCIVFLLLISVSILGNAQSLEKLKDDNGFSIFHFGDSVDVYDSNMILMRDMKAKTLFNYSGHDSTVYFLADLYVDGIFLVFDGSDKLIEFTFFKFYSSKYEGYIEWSEDEFNAMLSYFQFLYGEANEQQLQFSHEWRIDDYQLDLHIVSDIDNTWRRVEAVFSKRK